ncbi:MAG: hypothetical protein AAFU60_10400, partial [Bacteroidota bacterium]
LEAEVLLHLGLSEAVNEQDEIQQLRNSVQQIILREKEIVAKPSKRLMLFPLRLVAAFLVLVISLVVVFWYINQAPDAAVLARQNIDYPTSLYESGAIRSSDPAGISTDQAQKLDSLWTEINSLYQNQDYPRALLIMEELALFEEETDQGNSGSLYYAKGLLLAQNNQVEEAIATLQQVHSDYVDEANWKRAMLLLSLPSERTKALELIRQIAQAKVPRSEQAKTILEQLN